MFQKHVLAEAGSPSSPVLSPAEGKAAHRLVHPARGNTCLTHGAYSQYVSTAKWRPVCAKRLSAFVATSAKAGNAAGLPAVALV
ncbi:MAG: hypothetical protein VST67_08650 [Nitrospirota bacterium]|nr:hypothetical protein [Nitrospirota bacterium]